MSNIHFTKNYQLEAIRAELQKVLGALSDFVATPTPSAPIAAPIAAPITAPIAAPIVSEPCSMTSAESLTNARVAAYQKEMLGMERDHQEATAKMQDALTKTQYRYTETEMARRQLTEALRITEEKLA